MNATMLSGEHLDADCITRTFAYACWLFRDFGDQSKDIAPNVIIIIIIIMGTRWRRWLRHCATTRKVAGTIPNCVAGIFH